MPAQHAAKPSAPSAAEAEQPHLRGNMLERCNWLRWKVIPASPSSTAPGYKALKPLVLETPSSTKDRMFSMVPADAPVGPSVAGGNRIVQLSRLLETSLGGTACISSS